MVSELKISRKRGVVFALIPATMLLLLFEILLRLVPFRLEVDALQVESADHFEVRIFQNHLESRHFIRDPVTFWTPRPSKAPFNSFGYRGEELPVDRAPGEFRILAVGDSNTVGNKRTAWPNEIAGSAGARGLGLGEITMINAGVYGYTSFQGQHHLRRFLKYDPDLVLISFGGNGAAPNAVADKDFVVYQPHPIYLWLDHKSAVVNAIEYLAVNWGRSEAAPEPGSDSSQLVSRVSVEDYASNLEAMIASVRAAGAVPVLMTRPMAFDYRGPESSDPMKAYYHKTLEVARELETGLIDVDEMANHSWALFDDNAHFNDHGHRLIGSYVATALGDILSGSDYDPEELKFRPRNVDEGSTEAVKGAFSSWATLRQNLQTLSESRPGIDVASIYEANFTSDADGWRTSMLPRRKFKNRRAEASDGALCFADGPTWMTLERQDLELAEDLPHLLWVEAQSSSDFSIRIFWKSAASPDFDEADSVANSFYPAGGAPVYFFHVLPTETSSIRITSYAIRWQDAVCFTRIGIMSLSMPER